MNVQELRHLARDMGLKPGNRPKRELVRLIQSTEGNFACFATAVNGVCDQAGCLWRRDCFTMAKRAQ